ncbi:MAG: hypothetical protein QOG94_1213 [Solirubrobacteraceae bacterium]|nr:hypothetical protein [Solirubrobacteraceae bacterium]MEA2139817.1 hypothetical protein [Solirubrobacteraceae bacterium]
MVMLVVGVLGMLVMIQGSLASTSRTTAREQATNLARELVERSREIPYAQTTKSAAPAALAAVLPEHPAVSGSSFAVRRRNITYAVTVTGCSIDDAADGAGVGDGTYCASPTSYPGSPAVGSGFAAGANILGVPVSLAAGGSLLGTVCGALGSDSALAGLVGSTVASALGPLAGNGAEVLLCPAGFAGSVAYDATPDDLRRVRVRVAWTQGSQDFSLTQTTLLTTPQPA